MRDLENSLSPSSLRLPVTGTGRRQNEERLGNDRAVSRVTGIKPTSTTYLHSVHSDRPLRHGTIRQDFVQVTFPVLTASFLVCAFYFSGRKCDISSNTRIVKFSKYFDQNIYCYLLQF